MKKLNIPLFLLFLVLVSSSLGVFGQFNQLDVEQIKPIESLNTKAEENVPVVNNAGDEIYFMRTYVGKKKLSKAGQQIWSSRFNGEQWESPTEKQLSVNDNANNAVIGISKDHQRIYLFNSLDTRHKLAKGLGYVEMDESGKYSSPIGIDIPGFKVGNGYYSFYVTPDEQQFFIATAHDSTGFEDLFVSLRQADGSWGEIINLGNRINTSTIETTPFLTEDKRILYFSSDGHGGAGQADIFYTERIGESWTEWSKPVNMGSPINSEKFDANFILIDQERAIFSSNRNTDLSDLYEVIFTKKESDTLVEENVQQIAQSAVVFREEQGLMVGKVDLTRFSSSSSAPALLLVKDGNGNVVDTLLVNDQGEFTFESLPTDDYSLSLIGVEDEELIVFDMQDAVIESSPSDSPKGITVVQQSGGLMVGKVDLTRFSSSSSAPALLLVKDGNGNVVDTLLVNDQGEFTFESLPTDDYSLSLIGVEDEELIIFDMQEVKASLFNSKNVNDSAQITSNHSNSIKSASITSTTNKLEKIDEIKVYFGFDSAQIPDTALARINDFLASLRNKTIIKINLVGYTDTSGVSLYNLQLSERRAKSVRDYFVSQGHVEDKIELSGKGEENPDFPNDSREGRILNRRVKVTVSYKD